jgi:hypothetical protein
VTICILARATSTCDNIQLGACGVARLDRALYFTADAAVHAGLEAGLCTPRAYRLLYDGPQERVMLYVFE